MDQRSGHAEEAERSGAIGRSGTRARSTAVGDASLRADAGRRSVGTHRGPGLHEMALRPSGDIVSMSLLEQNPEPGAAGAARKRWTQQSS